VFAADAEVTQGVARNQGQNDATHEAVAKLLVQVLGLTFYEQITPTIHQYFALLAINGIMPEKGWQEGELITLADLARVLVQSMGLVDKVDNPDDPQSWLDVLEDEGVDLSSVRAASASLEGLPAAVGTRILPRTTDPLLTQTQLNPIDDVYYGVDMTSVRRILPGGAMKMGEVRRVVSGMETAKKEYRPKPPTPH